MYRTATLYLHPRQNILISLFVSGQFHAARFSWKVARYPTWSCRCRRSSRRRWRGYARAARSLRENPGRFAASRRGNVNRESWTASRIPRSCFSLVFRDAWRKRGNGKCTTTTTTTRWWSVVWSDGREEEYVHEYVLQNRVIQATRIIISTCVCTHDSTLVLFPSGPISSRRTSALRSFDIFPLKSMATPWPTVIGYRRCECARCLHSHASSVRENSTEGCRVNGTRDLRTTRTFATHAHAHARACCTRASFSYFVAEYTEMTATMTTTTSTTTILYVRASGTSTRLSRREVKWGKSARLLCDVDVRSFSFHVSYYEVFVLPSKLPDLINSWRLLAFWIILSLLF